MNKSILYLAFILFSVSVYGQGGLNLQGRWATMLDKAENYQHYKVVKKADLEDFWKAYLDSSKKVKMNVADLSMQIRHQQSEIEGLKKQLAETKAKLDGETQAKNNISFLGISVNKYSYTNTLWVIVFIVLGISAVCFFLYHNSNRVTRQKINEYEDLFNSFEEYKKNALEKERKLKREMQTYMNTLEEMKKRPSRV